MVFVVGRRRAPAVSVPSIQANMICARKATARFARVTSRARFVNRTRAAPLLVGDHEFGSRVSNLWHALSGHKLGIFPGIRFQGTFAGC